MVLTSKSGKYTYATIDSPNDNWYPAIVTDYEGCQEYGEVVCAFAEEFPPSDEQIQLFLDVLDAADKAGA